MLVVLEGIDGSGKTAHSKRLAERMGARWACFPDRSTPIGQLIDGYLRGQWRAAPTERFLIPKVAAGKIEADINAEIGSLNALVHQALQLSNRIEHLPLLKSSAFRDLVLDRYWQSGYAYGKADGLDGQYMMDLHKDLPGATVNILLDVPAEISVERARARGAPAEVYDRLDTLRRIRDNFMHLWTDMGVDSRWPIIDSRGTAEETAAAIDAAVAEVRRIYGHTAAEG